MIVIVVFPDHTHLLFYTFNNCLRYANHLKQANMIFKRSSEDQLLFFKTKLHVDTLKQRTLYLGLTLSFFYDNGLSQYRKCTGNNKVENVHRSTFSNFLFQNANSKTMLELVSSVLTVNTVLIGLVTGLLVHWLIQKFKYKLPPGPITLPLLGNSLRK